MDSNLRPFKCKSTTADNSLWSSACHGIREDKIICYRLFSIFLFIDLSTVTKFTQYNPYSNNLSAYCTTIFASYFCYLII